MSPRTSRRRTIAALAVACLLGGCSADPTDPDTDRPPVASLRSDGPTTAPSGSSDDERPLIPLDANAEERDRFQKVWDRCARETGGPGYQNAKNILLNERSGDATVRARAKKVRAACLAAEPETYEERQRRTDLPAFRDNERQWYQCARKAGYRLTAPDPETGEFGLAEVGPLGDYGSPRIQECRRRAFQD